MSVEATRTRQRLERVYMESSIKSKRYKKTREYVEIAAVPNTVNAMYY